jgi:outer membrane cobalamin receptor
LLVVTVGPVWAFLLASSVAVGQETVPSDLDDPGVVVLVEDEAPDGRAPSLWRTSLDTGDLRARGGDVAEGLQDLPGTYTTARGALGSRTEVAVRGASSGQVLLLFDGIPLNPVRGGGADLSLLPIGLLDRLELYRGGSATRFGGGAVGGAVNVVPDIPEEGARLFAHAGAGSFTTARGGLGASGGSAKAKGLVSVDWLSSSGEFEFLDEQATLHTRTNADVSRLGGLASAEIRQGSTTLRLLDMAVAADRGSPGPSEFQQTFDEARLEDHSNLLGAHLESRNLLSTADLALDGALAASWRHARTDYDNPDRYYVASVPYDTTAIEDSLTSTGTLSLFSERITVHVGADGTMARYQRSDLDVHGFVNEDLFSRRGAGASAHVEWLPVNGLSVLPAVRLEWVEGVGTVPAPSLGLVVSPLDQLDLVGNVGRAWRAPSLDELYLDTESLEGDPDLQSEDALSADFGPVWRPAKWFRVEVAAFYLDIDDLILFLPVSPMLTRAQNTGGATSWGLETALLVRAASWLALDGSYTLTRAHRDDPPQNPLPGRPTHKGSGTLRLTRQPLELFARVTARSTVFLDGFGNMENGPATFVDGGVAVEVAPGLLATLTAKNVLDKRDAVDANQYPLPGLSLFAQLSWNAEIGAIQ